MALCFGWNKKKWLRHGLENYIYKGAPQPDFLISLSCKCHLNFQQFMEIVMLYHVTFLSRAWALPYHETAVYRSGV